jgi:hypothetical protein
MTTADGHQHLKDGIAVVGAGHRPVKAPDVFAHGRRPPTSASSVTFGAARQRSIDGLQSAELTINPSLGFDDSPAAFMT